MIAQVNPSDIKATISLSSFAFALQWIGIFLTYLFFGNKYLPGKIQPGFPDSKGKVLLYKINGLLLYLLTIILYFTLRQLTYFSLLPLIQYFWAFFAAASFYGLFFSLLLLIFGRLSINYQPHQQNSKFQLLIDWWFGPVKNPRFFGVDLKMYFYLPSLIGLSLLILAFGEFQYIYYGQLTYNMMLYQIFWFFWFFTHFVREDFMLSTWDIIAENFGFMLVWGDLAYLPFLYCIGGWHLASNQEESSLIFQLLLVFIYILFHAIYRTANWQKYDYRRKGNKILIWGKPPQTLQGKLLISGWWGIGRHLNYTGEIVVYLTIALCGYQSMVSFILPVSLLSMLIQRADRDDKKCREKYGTLWDEYCSIAKFKIIPYVY